MGTAPDQRLKVLVAHEQSQLFPELETIVRELGHDVFACEPDPDRLVDLSYEHSCDVALVGLDHNREHALALVANVTDDAACPVITIVYAADPALVAATIGCGAFASVAHDDPADARHAIETNLQHIAAARDHDEASDSQALIERAKGILMERHQIGERDAFELLHRQAHNDGHTLTDAATTLDQPPPLA